jgi:hypothetical protein
MRSCSKGGTRVPSLNAGGILVCIWWTKQGGGGKCGKLLERLLSTFSSTFSAPSQVLSLGWNCFMTTGSGNNHCALKSFINNKIVMVCLGGVPSWGCCESSGKRFHNHLGFQPWGTPAGHEEWIFYFFILLFRSKACYDKSVSFLFYSSIKKISARCNTP